MNLRYRFLPGGPPLTDDDIRDIERAASKLMGPEIRLPFDYRSFLKKFNGGVFPFEIEYPVIESPVLGGDKGDSGLKFTSYARTEDGGMETHGNLTDSTMEGLLVIANGVAGTLLMSCGTGQHGHGRIYYRNFDRGYEGSRYEFLVAKSFREFMESVSPHIEDGTYHVFGSCSGFNHFDLPRVCPAVAGINDIVWRHAECQAVTSMSPDYESEHGPMQLFCSRESCAFCRYSGGLATILAATGVSQVEMHYPHDLWILKPSDAAVQPFDDDGKERRRAVVGLVHKGDLIRHPTSEEVRAAVRELGGGSLYLQGRGGASMTIGGERSRIDRTEAFVIQATLDGKTFQYVEWVPESPVLPSDVLAQIGGQKISVPRTRLLGESTVEEAAEEFLRRGRLCQDLTWVRA